MSLLLLFTPRAVIPDLLTIITTTIANATLDVAYNQTVHATGGTAPYSFSVTSGALPDGLSLNASTGAITGTPTVEDTFDFTITVTDDDSATDTQDFTVIVTDLPVVSWPPSNVAEGYQAGRIGQYINLATMIANRTSAGFPTGELQKILDTIQLP